jgi:hypothetical protein
MGAYSSWAMLAVFNHVLVRMSALKCGLQGFTDYCVLGDDVVIAHEGVAKEYRAFLSELGIGVSISKGIESSTFLEFAKRLKGPGLDLTPLGAGLILQVIRKGLLLPLLISEMLRIGILTTPGSALRLLDEFGFKQMRLGFLAIFRLDGLYYPKDNGVFLPDYLFYGAYPSLNRVAIFTG